jgi:hypothetical protein
VLRLDATQKLPLIVGSHVYQRFALNAELTSVATHKLETRVFWHDKSFVKIDKVVVNIVD